MLFRGLQFFWVLQRSEAQLCHSLVLHMEYIFLPSLSLGIVYWPGSYLLASSRLWKSRLKKHQRTACGVLQSSPYPVPPSDSPHFAYSGYCGSFLCVTDLIIWKAAKGIFAQICIHGHGCTWRNTKKII